VAVVQVVIMLMVEKDWQPVVVSRAVVESRVVQVVSENVCFTPPVQESEQ
jgi:hypothetical protein